MNNVDIVSNLGTHFTDCTPQVSFASATLSTVEGTGAGPTTVTVTMNISPAATGAGSVVITAGNGAGVTSPADYTTDPALSGSDITVPITLGATSVTFDVDIVTDATDEGNELVTFSISSVSAGFGLGAIVAQTFNILDDDGPPAVNFTTTNIAISEFGGPSVTFNVSVSPLPVTPVALTVTVAIANGPGLVYDPPGYSGGDYYVTGAAGSPFTFVIPAGSSTGSFTAWIWNDGVPDAQSIETATFTITAVSSGGTVGSSTTSYLNISDLEAPPTVLAPGDLMIVGVNANNDGCTGSTGEDRVSFFSFKPITTGTKLILTDNGYGRCAVVANSWSNNEGVVEMTRTGPTIPAGQVITYKITNTKGAGNVVGLAPDAGWTCANINAITSAGALNLVNTTGDAIFFLQGGTWNSGTTGNHNATYTGTILYAFSTIPWYTTNFCSATLGTSYSQLPPGVNCFSMSPTGTPQWNKLSFANILTTSLTQRNWIIAGDTPSNWVSAPNCGSYNSTSPNWLLAPTLNIIPGTPTPGLWRGTTSTDWFECKNWDDVTVPLVTTSVRIDETATRHCEVATTAFGPATCAQIVQTSSGTARNLTVTNGSILTVDGPITVQRSTAGVAPVLAVAGASTLSCTDLTIGGVTPGTVEATFRNEDSLNVVTIEQDFSILSGGYVDLRSATANSGGRIFIGRDYSNAGPTETTLDDLYGTLIFNGPGTQIITTAGFEEVLHNLTLEKAAGTTLVLDAPVRVRANLKLTTGIVDNDAPSPQLLTMATTSKVIGGSDASFVNGMMSKLGNSDFLFPIGKGTVMRPAGVRSLPVWPPLNFTAEYFPISAYSWGTVREAPLHHLSDCEHWLIDEHVMSAGTLTAVVDLTWRSPYSCGVDNLAELLVARWDDSGIWRDRGNGGATGNVLNGTIPTAAGQNFITHFNANDTTAWTLASTTANNPLPITLVDFTARPEGSAVRLNWVTASEYENALFTVERSKYGIEFEHVVDVPGAVFSTGLLNYTDLDRSPYSGLSYYRLRQTDLDGTFTYSTVLPVVIGGVADRPLVVFGREGTVTAVHDFKAGSRYELMDMTGRIISTGNTTMDGRTEVNGADLTHGAYVFRVRDGERMESERFVY